MTSSPAIIPDRLNALSEGLRAASVDLYLQPMGDEFQGEYVPAHAARLPFLTGFTGSAGLGAFWANPADHLHVLFVDGRYTIQAEQELEGSGINWLNSGEVTLAEWLAREGGKGLRIAFDPWLIGHTQLQNWKKSLAALDVIWVALAQNPVDAIWQDRPAAPAGEVQLHPETLAGTSYPQKRAQALASIRAANADGAIFTLPDGVNWLLNIRGGDIPFNPLLLSYFVLQENGQGVLFTHERPFSAEFQDYLTQHQVRVAPLAAIFQQQALPLEGKRFLIDPSVSNEGWWQLAAQNKWELVAQEDASLLPKACKNAVELEGMRAAHRRDGVALSRFLSWFDGQVTSGRLPEELQVVEVLEQYRARDNRYRGASFATIAGSGMNGAIVHYRASEKTNRRARKGELFLLDSGGQYDDGTTDVTRTIAVSGASPKMCEHFTRVLKGHIALATAKFPEGTAGIQLDTLARQYLWEAGLDYDHGTGHGVGAFLCVHEGPQRISKKGSMVPLKPGMILSNEPGYYESGQYGIRIENLVAVVEVGTARDGKKLLGFETLTLAPIDTRLVVIDMLTSSERNWLNDYHQRVFKALEGQMDSREKAWLQQATRAV